MKMRKLFAGLLATSMLAAGTSAFAATANDAGYVKDAGTYSIAADLSAYGSDQMTILIIPEAAYNAESISDADILYIDQAAADTENIFANVGILGGTTLADGTYYVKIGGENIAEDGIIVETFTITTTAEGPTYSRVKGDVIGSVAGEITLDDASATLQISLDLGTWDDDQKYAADVVGSVEGEITLDDAAAVLQKSLSLDVTFK